MSEGSYPSTAFDLLDKIDALLDSYQGLPGEPGHHALVAIGTIIELQIEATPFARLQHGAERLIGRDQFIQRGRGPLSLVPNPEGE